MQKGSLRGTNAMAGPQKIRLPEDHRRRQPARTDEFLRAVTVGENPVQQGRALNQARLERAPFIRRDDKRDRVQLPRPLHAARIAVNIVGDALLMNEALAGFLPALEFRRAELLQRREQSGVMRTRLAVVSEKLIKPRGTRLVAGQ